MAKRLLSYPLSLAVVVAALVTITGGWIAWWNYRSGLENTRGLAHDLFAQIAHQTADSTTAFLAKAPPAAEALRNLEGVNEGTLVAVLRANPSFTWVSYSSASGEFTGAYYPKPGQIRLNHSAIAGGKTVLDEHDLVDGDVAKKTLFKHDDDSKYDPRTRPFYTLAMAAKSGVWTPPYVFFEKIPGITYALPLGDRGVFTVDFDLKRLSDLALSLKPSAHGRVAIVDAAGAVLAHPTAVLTTPDQKRLVTIEEVADPALRAVLAAGDAESVDIGGERYLASIRTIDVPSGSASASAPASGSASASGTPAWRVVVYAPEGDFTADVQARVVSSLLISLAAVIIAVIIAWLIARRVSGPLTALADDMSRVGDFRIEDSAEPRRSLFREIELMNRALVKMKGGLRSFGRFVPRDLVRSVLASGREATLAGELRTLTVYFSDIAGFTSLAESMKPDELVRFLGKYFEDASNIIADERGTVDKYLGDGIMAFWGAPEEVADHAARACAAALRCHLMVRGLGGKISARIGIATGEVLVGNIGSPERMNYTVMGDTANLASRLEGLNKQYGSELMISEATFELAKGAIVARPIDVVAVKGKSRGVRVYELLAMASDGDTGAVALAADATRALDAYLARDFAAAIAAWDAVLARKPDDKAASGMRDRAIALRDAPPDASWTGVTIATEK